MEYFLSLIFFFASFSWILCCSKHVFLVCMPTTEEEKKRNNQQHRRANRHFIATVAQFVEKITSSNRHTHEHSHLPNIPRRRRLLCFYKRILYYMHVNWFITVGKKSREIIRFDDDSNIRETSTFYYCAQANMFYSHTASVYVSLPAVCVLVFAFVLVWNAYTPVG